MHLYGFHFAFLDSNILIHAVCSLVLLAALLLFQRYCSRDNNRKSISPDILQISLQVSIPSLSTMHSISSDRKIIGAACAIQRLGASGYFAHRSERPADPITRRPACRAPQPMADGTLRITGLGAVPLPRYFVPHGSCWALEGG